MKEFKVRRQSKETMELLYSKQEISNREFCDVVYLVRFHIQRNGCLTCTNNKCGLII